MIDKLTQTLRCFTQTAVLVFLVASAAPLAGITNEAFAQATATPATVTSFSANPSAISQGKTSTLSWNTTNTTSVSISGVAGTQPTNGFVSVSPDTTTTYTLTATGTGGTTTATTTVTVTVNTGSPAIAATIPIPANSVGTVDVNSTTNRIYTSGGASFDAQVVAAIDGNTNSVIGTVPGSGAHVNTLTNRIYAGQLIPTSILVYDGTNDSLVTQIPLGGCAIAAAVDATLNRVYGSTQCGAGNDLIFPIDASTNTRLHDGVGSGGVMGNIVVNPVTHTVYISTSGVSKTIDPTSFAVTNSPFSGVVQAVNDVTNRLYAQHGTTTQVIDGAKESVLATLSGAGPVAVDSGTNRVYVAEPSSSSVKIFNGATNGLISTVHLPAGSSPSAIAANSATGRVYLVVTNVSAASLLVITPGAIAPTVVSFTASPTTIFAGQSSTLSWSTTSSASVSINGVTGAQPANGSVSVSPAATTTYTLTATGAGGKVTATALVTVKPMPPTVVSFTANPTIIAPGQPSTLSWTTTNTTSVVISGIAGTHPANGSVSVSPPKTTTYILTATGAGGKALATTTVKALPPVVISFTASPATITVGKSSTLSWTTANATSVSISSVAGTHPSNGFASVSPATTTTYTLTVTGGGGTATATTTVTAIVAIPIFGNSAVAVDVNSTTNRIYTSGGASFDTQMVTVIDGNTNRVVVTALGSGAHVNTRTNRIYAGQLKPSSVRVYDGVDDRLVTQIPLGGCAIGAAVDSLLNRVYASAQCGSQNDLIFPIDSSTNTPLTTAGIGSGGVMGEIVVNSVTHTIYISTSGVSKKLDPTGFAVAKSPFSGVVKAVNFVTNRMYAQDGLNTQVIDGATESVLATLPAGGPVAVDSSENRVYVSDAASSSIRIFDGATNGLTGNILLPFGSSPGAIAINDATGRVYLISSNASGSNLLVIAIAPTVTSFTATPSTISLSKASTLRWTTTNATSVSISGVAGTHPANGSITVSPVATTTYTLTATGKGGAVSTTTTVVVVRRILPI